MEPPKTEVDFSVLSLTSVSSQPPPAHAREPVWNVPNAISLARVVLGAVVFAWISMQWYMLALILFIVASLTDALDGYIARKLNQVTALGRQLDPLVDKIVVAGAFIFLLPISTSGIDPWMVTLIVTRELVIQALRSHLEGNKIAFGAKWSGKLKTTLQCVAIGAVLVNLAWPGSDTLVLIRDASIWTALGFTIYSGCEYLVISIKLLKPF